jgi:hypothetical protein
MASLRWEVDMNARTLYALLILMIGTSHALAADDVIDGRLGPGALYRLVRPPNWNGNLVLYAHGYISTKEDSRCRRKPESSFHCSLPKGSPLHSPVIRKMGGQ